MTDKIVFGSSKNPDVIVKRGWFWEKGEPSIIRRQDSNTSLWIEGCYFWTKPRWFEVRQWWRAFLSWVKA